MQNFLFLIMFLLNAFLAISQIGGTYTYQFLKLPYSARIAALGGNNVSCEDLNFIGKNPALLDKKSNNNLIFNFSIFKAGIKWGNFIFAKDFDKYGTFAFSLNFINYGKFVMADANGNITGEFKASEYIANFSWAIKIDSFFKFGINLKNIYSDLYQYKSYGIAADIGVYFTSKDTLATFGLVFRNIGTQLKPYIAGQKEPLPFEVDFGTSLGFRHAPFRFSITVENLQKWNLLYSKPLQNQTTNLNGTTGQRSKFGDYAENALRHFIFGVEILPSDKIYFSLGWNYRRFQELRITDVYSGAGFGAGLGLKIYKFSINYSFSKFFVGTNTHNFTIAMNIKSFKNKKL